MAYEKNRRRPPVEDDGTLIEGRNAVLETLRAGRAVDKVFVAEGAHIGDVAAEARRHRVPVVTCDRRKLDGMSPTGNHQGVIAQAAAQEYVSLDDIFRVAEERSEVPLIVVCDGIEDPHNLGAIIRSAETAGAHGVIIPKRRAVGLTAAVARSAAGALAYVGVHKANNLASTLDELKERGVWLFGAEADGTVGLYDAPFDRPTAIINQANASVLSQVLMALHDAGMSIPQDVSVLSCGTYFEGEPTRFPITEMPVMPEELCAEAMNLLVSAIEEHTDIKGSVELIEPALKRRGSVAEAGSGGTI